MSQGGKTFDTLSQTAQFSAYLCALLTPLPLFRRSLLLPFRPLSQLVLLPAADTGLQAGAVKETVRHCSQVQALHAPAPVLSAHLLPLFHVAPHLGIEKPRVLRACHGMSQSGRDLDLAAACHHPPHCDRVSHVMDVQLARTQRSAELAA